MLDTFFRTGCQHHTSLKKMYENQEKHRLMLDVQCGAGQNLQDLVMSIPNLKGLSLLWKCPTLTSSIGSSLCKVQPAIILQLHIPPAASPESQAENA